MYHENNWIKHISKRQDPGETEQSEEPYGDYLYFVRHKNPMGQLGADQTKGSYPVYLRYHHDPEAKYASKEEAMENSQSVLDFEEISFINSRLHEKTSVDKITVSDDHSKIAFTLDIGNTEVLTGIVKDMTTLKMMNGIKLENVC